METPARQRDLNPRALLSHFVTVYRAAKFSESTAGAASLGERVSGSKPGSSHLTLGTDLPVSDRLVRSFARWLDVWEREVQGQRPGVPSGDKVSAARKAQSKAILGEVGMDPTAVAFIYGTSTEAVRKLRGRHDRDPDTGQRTSELRVERIDGAPTHRAPLTAPAPAALKRLEERHADGEYSA